MIQGDCLDVLPSLQHSAFHWLFCDLPYQMTAASWDFQLPLGTFWRTVLGCVAECFSATFTAIHPFAAQLVASQRRLFRYDLVWDKARSSNFFQAKYRPLRTHENILHFARGKATYNPQMWEGQGVAGRVEKGGKCAEHYGVKHKIGIQRGRMDNLRQPISIQRFPREMPGKKGHPNQKPIKLLRWLVASYSQPGDHVLDPTAGQATTAVAALALGRHVVAIEKDPHHFEAGVERVRRAVAEMKIAVSLQVLR